MLRIDDPQALATLARLEGERWWSLQQAHLGRPYSFGYLLAAWNAKQQPQYREDDDVDWHDFLENGEPVIYGEGGYHRYVVRADGVIAFSRLHARDENVARAQALGFNLC